MGIKEINKVKDSELLFYLAYVIWTVNFVINQTYYSDILPVSEIYNILRVVIYLLLYTKFIIDNPYNKKILSFIIIMGLVFITTINSKLVSIMEIFLFIYSARNIDIKRIIKISLILHISLMIIIVVSSFIGIIENNVWYREDNSIRYGIGYRYTTFLANYFFHIVLMYVFLKELKNVTLVECISIIIINKVIYYYTDTKAVFYLVNLAIIMLYIYSKNNVILEKTFIQKNICKYCFPIFALITILITKSYTSSNYILNIMNKVLTGRLSLGKLAYDQYGISILGQPIIWNTGNIGVDEWGIQVYNYVDSSYVNILLNFGLVILIFICIGFVIVGKEAVKMNNINLYIVLIFIALHSITDPQLIELGYNPFILMISVIFGYTQCNKNTLETDYL